MRGLSQYGKPYGISAVINCAAFRGGAAARAAPPRFTDSAANVDGESRMIKHKTWVAALAAGLAAGGANAAGLDGTGNVVCAAMEVVACASGIGCVQGSARSFELPEFMFVDFKDKVVHARTEGDARKVTSPIRVAEKTNAQLVMQGIENGHGWTMTIDQSSGRMTTTVSGEAASFMIFGACTAL